MSFFLDLDTFREVTITIEKRPQTVTRLSFTLELSGEDSRVRELEAAYFNIPTFAGRWLGKEFSAKFTGGTVVARLSHPGRTLTLSGEGFFTEE